MTTDRPDTFESRDMRDVVGFGMAREAARQVYEAAGVGPSEPRASKTIAEMTAASSAG